jgi:hypothetical protein
MFIEFSPDWDQRNLEAEAQEEAPLGGHGEAEEGERGGKRKTD